MEDALRDVIWHKRYGACLEFVPIFCILATNVVVLGFYLQRCEDFTDFWPGFCALVLSTVLNSSITDFDVIAAHKHWEYVPLTRIQRYIDSPALQVTLTRYPRLKIYSRRFSKVHSRQFLATFCLAPYFPDELSQIIVSLL